LACSPGEANGYGVIVADGATGTTIGASGALNVIVCNANEGVMILGTGGTYNTTVHYNHIGTNGSAARGNGAAGIYNGSAGGTVIRNNVISGNAWAGVWVFNSAGVTVAGNYIGTNSIGSAPIPNGHDGVALTDGTTNSTIGGSVLADRNVISGNTLCGVRIRDGSQGNSLDFNLIGLNAAGTAAIPNGEAGVAVFNANNNMIGSSRADVTQFLSGNTREGVYLEHSSGTFMGWVNLIGVAVDGVTPSGNGLQGVMINGGGNNTVILERVAYNGGAGLAVVGDTATGNIVTARSNRRNGGLPVDLGNDGYTPNGSRIPPGPNNWINYPVLTSAVNNVLTGTACAGCKVLIYQAEGNPATPGGGGTYWMETVADSSGNWSAALSPGSTGRAISLQACEAPCSMIGNVSEMSPLWRVFLPEVIR
jgi:parallel beta-helix repeat protein